MTKGARDELLLLLQKCVRYDIIISPINKNFMEALLWDLLIFLIHILIT